MATDNLESTREQQTTNPVQRQWPQLGRELYTLERALAAHFVTYGHTHSENEKRLESGEPDREDLKNIEILWAEVVRRLHVRIYDNPEFEMTITEQYEQLEKLVSIAPMRTEEEKAYKTVLLAEYDRLKTEINNMNKEKKEQERQERKERERIRNEKLKAYNHFRDATYALLKETGISESDIEVNDSQWTDATIIETIRLPKAQDREDYKLTRVTLTPQQVEGYMFLTELGDIGGDPLARTVLSST